MVNFNFFYPVKHKGSKIQTGFPCNHVGFLEYDGYNNLNKGKIHRIKCSKCGKRFGNNVRILHLYEYQTKIKKIVYELFFYKYPVSGTAKRWGIPQDKLSRFKKNLIHQIYTQNKDLIEVAVKSLPGGVMLGDETFMGSMGNSNVQILFINNIFEMLSTGPAKSGQLKASIIKTFKKIPEICRYKLNILLTDGEPSYKSIPQLYSKSIIHVIQYHNKGQLGQISVEKYEVVGPHLFHYIIHTHWKAFQKNKRVLRFRWEIKLIRSLTGTGSGRLPKSLQMKQQKLKWRQKLDRYENGRMEKNGSAEVFINFDNKKISMRAGSSRWMIRMLQPVFKIFMGRCVTTGYVESKHHQIKSAGAGRKQKDPQYSHELFALCSFAAEHGYLPETNFQGRPLFKYLTDKPNSNEIAYRMAQNGINVIQKTLLVE